MLRMNNAAGKDRTAYAPKKAIWIHEVWKSVMLIIFLNAASRVSVMVTASPHAAKQDTIKQKPSIAPDGITRCLVTGAPATGCASV